MNYAATNIDLIQPDDLYNEIQAEIERIHRNDDRLHDAVMDGCSGDYELAQLRIKLWESAWIIDQLARGYTLDQIMADTSRTGQQTAFAELCRISKEASAYVDDKVLQAAKDEVES